MPHETGGHRDNMGEIIRAMRCERNNDLDEQVTNDYVSMLQISCEMFWVNTLKLSLDLWMKHLVLTVGWKQTLWIQSIYPLTQVCSPKACGSLTHWQTQRPGGEMIKQKLQRLQTVFHLWFYYKRSNKKQESTSRILCGKPLQNIYSYIKDNLCASKFFFFCQYIIIN